MINHRKKIECYFFIILIILTFSSVRVFSQDLIRLKDGRRYKCKIEKEDSLNVYLKVFQNDEVINTTLPKEKIYAYYYDSLKMSFKPNNVIKTNLLGYIVNTPSFCYERVLSKYLTAHVIFSFGLDKTTNGNKAKNEYFDQYDGLSTDFAIGDYRHTTTIKNFWGVGLNFYLPTTSKRQIPSGIHLGSSFNMMDQTEVFTIDDLSLVERRRYETVTHVKSLNFNFGYQYLFYDFISLEVIAGPGLAFVDGYEKKYNYTDDFKSTEFSILLAVNVGFAFGVNIPK